MDETIKALPIYKRAILGFIEAMGYRLVKKDNDFRVPEIDPKRVPDFTCYRPTFCPWLCDQAFLERYKRISSVSLVSQDSCYTLWTLPEFLFK